MTSEVFNEDCMVGMARYPDKFFDLAIVDPPYGIGIANRNGSIGQKKGQGVITKYKSKAWDVAIPDAAYFNELFRISKEQIIWGANYFCHLLPPSMGWIVWDKKQPEGVSFAMAELAFSSVQKSVKIFSCSRALIGNKVANNKRLALSQAKIHPTQKPIKLYEWLLQNYAKEGDKIIDTHMGSQSSRIAAYLMGFDYWGWEIDQEYFEKGDIRFAELTAQQQLFR